MNVKNEPPFVQEVYKKYWDTWKAEKWSIAFNEPKEAIYGGDRVEEYKKELDLFIKDIVARSGYDYNDVKEALRTLTEIDSREIAEFYAHNPVTGC